MSPPPTPAPPRSRHRQRALVWWLDRLFHLLVQVWAAVIVGGLAVSALLSLIQNGVPGLTDPNKYLIVYVFALLFFLHPVISLATIGTILLLTGVGLIGHVASAH
jgi:hypothetical protein